MKTILFYLSFQPIHTKYQSIKKFRITLSGYTEFLLSICYKLFDFLKINTLYLSATCMNMLQISCKPENKHP